LSDGRMVGDLSHLWAVLQLGAGVRTKLGEPLAAVRRVVHQVALGALRVRARASPEGGGALLGRGAGVTTVFVKRPKLEIMRMAAACGSRTKRVNSFAVLARRMFARGPEL
jgi:hypothetical protein